MERVGQTLNRTGYHGSGNATDLTKQILADQEWLTLFKNMA